MKNETNENEITNFLQISIKDNGIGISDENIEKIFNPFFSTKPTEKGTGLGLSISNAIIKRHRGSIRVESKINEGTVFYINLPIKRDLYQERAI